MFQIHCAYIICSCVNTAPEKSDQTCFHIGTTNLAIFVNISNLRDDANPDNVSRGVSSSIISTKVS